MKSLVNLHTDSSTTRDSVWTNPGLFND